MQVTNHYTSEVFRVEYEGATFMVNFLVPDSEFTSQSSLVLAQVFEALGDDIIKVEDKEYANLISSYVYNSNKDKIIKLNGKSMFGYSN